MSKITKLHHHTLLKKVILSFTASDKKGLQRRVNFAVVSVKSPLINKNKTLDYVFSPERAQSNWAKLRKYIHAVMLEGR